MSLQTRTAVVADRRVPRRVRSSVGERVLSEALFRSAVTRERRRADRSGQPMALFVIDLQGMNQRGDVRIWRPVIAAVQRAKRDCDVLGWLRGKETVGLLVTEIPPPCDVAARDISE